MDSSRCRAWHDAMRLPAAIVLRCKCSPCVDVVWPARANAGWWRSARCQSCVLCCVQQPGMQGRDEPFSHMGTLYYQALRGPWPEVAVPNTSSPCHQMLEQSASPHGVLRPPHLRGTPHCCLVQLSQARTPAQVRLRAGAQCSACPMFSMHACPSA